MPIAYAWWLQQAFFCTFVGSCWMKAPVVSCCMFFFSVPYPLRLKVVDALGHCVSIRHKGLQFTGWNGADLEGLLEHMFPYFLQSPRAAASLLMFSIEDHTGESVGVHTNNMASPVSVWPSFMDATHVDPAHSRISTWGSNLPK